MTRETSHFRITGPMSVDWSFVGESIVERSIPLTGGQCVECVFMSWRHPISALFCVIISVWYFKVKISVSPVIGDRGHVIANNLSYSWLTKSPGDLLLLVRFRRRRRRRRRHRHFSRRRSANTFQLSGKTSEANSFQATHGWPVDVGKKLASISVTLGQGH